MDYKNTHPFYKVLDEKLNKLEENINEEKDYAQFKNFSLDKYLLMVLGHTYPFYKKALKKGVKKSKVKIDHEDSLISPLDKSNNFKYFLKNFKIVDNDKIERFLNGFIEEIGEFYFYNIVQPIYVEKIEKKEDKFLLIYNGGKNALSVKINSLDIFHRMSLVYIDTKEIEFNKENAVNEEKTKVYIEDNKLINEFVEKKDVFGLISPPYNILDSFYNNVKEEEKENVVKETKKWLLQRDFLIERMINSCGGHGHDDLLEKHPIKIVDNIKKYDDWGTVKFCKHNKCGNHKCCYHIEENDFSCKEPTGKFYTEIEQEFKNTFKRMVGFINDQYLFNNLPESNQMILKENISFIQRNNILEKKEEQAKKTETKGG